jgi:putative transposase
MSVPRSSWRYVSRKNDSVLRERLVGLAREYLRFSNRRLHILLRRDGEAVNHKRVQRRSQAILGYYKETHA